MTPDLHPAVPHTATLLGVGALVLFSLYRRVRRNLGPQPMRPVRMGLRLAVLAIAALALALAPTTTMDGRLGECAGLLAGALLGWIGLRLTRFERRPEGDFYTPNPWLGSAISLLFVARLAYRFAALSPMLVAGDGSASGPALPPAAAFGGPQSTVTLLVFGLVVGYYVCYLAGALWRKREMDRAPVAVAEPVAPAASAMESAPPLQG